MLPFHCRGLCLSSAHATVPPAGRPVQCGWPAGQPAAGPSEPGFSPSLSSNWTAALHAKKAFEKYTFISFKHQCFFIIWFFYHINMRPIKRRAISVSTHTIKKKTSPSKTSDDGRCRRGKKGKEGRYVLVSDSQAWKSARCNLVVHRPFSSVRVSSCSLRWTISMRRRSSQCAPCWSDYGRQQQQTFKKRTKSFHR